MDTRHTPRIALVYIRGIIWNTQSEIRSPGKHTDYRYSGIREGEEKRPAAAGREGF